MAVRPATPEDCEALTRMVRTSRAYEGDYRRIVASVSVTEETLRRNVVRVYDDGGRVLGFYSLTCRPDEAELDLMFVADDAGGAGIGRALFADMAQVARARGYPGVVIVSHPPSVGFYERMGARRVGVKPPGGNATWERPRLWYDGRRAGPEVREMFRLRFPQEEIALWAARNRSSEDARLMERLAPRIRARGHLTRREFVEFCEWKTPRSRPIVARNAAARIREVTALALAASDDGAKIRILRLLDGVGWPTASVLLHFCDARPYPILDYRALWSLGFSRPPAYTVDFWLAYTRFMRELAAASGHSMRELDRALWQYSKDNQRSA